MNSIKQQIIQWSNQFPLDKWYRRKYNLSFNCQQHRDTNPIDIYFEYLEDRVFEEYAEELKLKDEKKSLYRNGQWLTDRSQGESTEAELETFKNIPLEAFSNMTAKEDAEN